MYICIIRCLNIQTLTIHHTLIVHIIVTLFGTPRPPTLKLTKVGNRLYNLYSRRFKKNIKPSS